MKSKRGKRNGLRARSKNVRTVKRQARPANRVLAVMQLTPRTEPRPMVFYRVDEGAPAEGKQVFVKLANDAYRYGIVMEGHFCAYDHLSERFVSFAHPERITHWMEIASPIDAENRKAEGESPQAQPPDIEREAQFQADGEMPPAEEPVPPGPYEDAVP